MGIVALVFALISSFMPIEHVMQVTLTSQGEELLRLLLARHPGHSPAEIVEQALAQHVRRETVAPLPAPNGRAELEAALDALAAHLPKIPLGSRLN